MSTFSTRPNRVIARVQLLSSKLRRGRSSVSKTRGAPHAAKADAACAGPVRVCRAVWHVLAIALMLGVAGFAGAAYSEELPPNEVRAALKHAFAQEDAPAVQRLIEKYPQVIPALFSGYSAMALLPLEPLRFATIPPAQRERARAVIRAMVRAGVPLGHPLLNGTLISLINRLPGEQPFVHELLRAAPTSERCALVHSIASEAWTQALSDLALLTPQERGSPACGALFNIAASQFTGDGLVPQVQALLQSGVVPTAQATAHVLRNFAATDMPAGHDTQAVLTRLLHAAPLDTEFRQRGESAWSPTETTTTVFSFLLGTTFAEQPNPLARNLWISRTWLDLLGKHPAEPLACGANVSKAVAAWPNDSFGTSEMTTARWTGLVAGTTWLIAHCAPAQLAQLPWSTMIRTGHASVAELGERRGLMSPTDSRADEWRKEAMAYGAYSLYVRLMRGQAVAQSLAPFFATMRPPERLRPGDGSAGILRWLLAHGADPNMPIAGSAPIAITRFYDRDDLTSILLDAGARKTRLTGATRATWLARRLVQVAGGWLETHVSGAPQRVDLSDDGQPEYVLHGEANTANSEVTILAYRNRRWRVVLDDSGVDVDFLASRHHGWRDIRVTGRASAVDSETRLYHYDGTVYQVVCDSEFDHGGPDAAAPEEACPDGSKPEN